MKTLLVPVDFSDTSVATIRFAAAWAQDYEYKRIILLKTFYQNVFSDIVVSAEYGAVNHDFMEDHRQEAMTHLERLSNVIVGIAGDMRVDIVTSKVPILRAVIALIREESPEMVMLGSEHGADDSLISRNVIAIAKASPVRVMVVPSGYRYRPVRNALVPCDFNALHSLDKLNKLKASPHLWERTHFMVLNVDPEEHYLHPDEQFREDERNLHEYLKDFHHELHYRNDKDILGSIINFTAAHEAQLIVALPGKHSFLYYLTHKSISEALCRSARVPVVILK
ncbi:universal stress protein [Chitinophaga polysaccharea]|uniref:universal stress protein n=1 Tax=Chitinophaga polysaccharea TaxID=1293035 RepID=UPI0014558DBF|nr:universal stress protein [Chitinophaga polysaccharea]NLR57587.1 universal stress protein [Chitinophaga polysaccharea]